MAFADLTVGSGCQWSSSFGFSIILILALFALFKVGATISPFRINTESSQNGLSEKPVDRVFIPKSVYEDGAFFI